MTNEERIRERARIIWENEGRPKGRDEKDYWKQAARELGLGDGINVVAGDLPEGVSQGGHPVTVLSGEETQEEPPYAGVDPNADRNR
jgi:hypothetical protein